MRGNKTSGRGYNYAKANLEKVDKISKHKTEVGKSETGVNLSSQRMSIGQIKADRNNEMVTLAEQDSKHST